MRIAYVTETYPPELNGVSLTVERTVRYLRGRNHGVDLIRPRQRHEATLDGVDEWRSAGCAIPMYPDLRFGLARPGQLRERFLRTRPELVHLATPGPLAWAALAAARSLAIPASSDFRTNFHHYSRHYGLGLLSRPVLAGLAYFHNLTRRTFVPTRATRRELAAAGFQNLSVVGRGVDAERFNPTARSDELRRQWQAGDGPVALYVGRIAAEKNVELAMRAFGAVKRAQPSARFIVVGDGPARTRLEARFPEARFVGTKSGDELAEHYASADLFLFPSLSDTFGNVVLESLSSGLPVVAFDCAAASEHVVDRQSGRLVVPGDERGFMAAACELAGRLARSPEARHELRDACVEAARLASWDDVLARFEAHLASTLDARQTPPARLPLVA